MTVIQTIKEDRDLLHSLIEAIKNGALDVEGGIYSNGEQGAVLDWINYAQRVKYNLLEARMHLGNMLKFINDEPDPYEKAAEKRRNGESNYIPESVTNKDTYDLDFSGTKIETLDYIRLLLKQRIKWLTEVRKQYNDHSIETQELNTYLAEAKICLATARNYCGMILGCIRDIQNVEGVS
jgi:hypothetical protein